MATRGSGREGGRDDRDKRNKRKYTAQEKGKGLMPSSGKNETGSEKDEDGLPNSWDWRREYGVLGLVLDQKLMAICWAIALVRAIQALYNINLPHPNQAKELSIQHVVNNVPYNEDDGIQNVKRAFTFASTKGTCSSSQCSSNTFDNSVSQSFKCRHPANINTETIDGFEYLAEVNDDELKAIVARQPVVGILRNPGDDFSDIGSRIYRSPTGSVDVSFHQVLIVGYGFDDHGQPYWIIQNSYGERWGDGGFGYVHRRIKSGRGSEFHAVAYPKKRGYPREKDGV